MERNICDHDYIGCLSPIYAKRYRMWKTRVLGQMEAICADILAGSGPEDLRNKFALSPQDVKLMCELGYFTEHEVQLLQENAVK